MTELLAPGERISDYAQKQLHQAITCLGWRDSRAHAGVHQARKSLRRVRACLALGEQGLGAGAAMLDRELARLCKSLSGLRDADSNVACLDRLLATPGQERVHQSLMAARGLAKVAQTESMRSAQSLDKGFRTRRKQLQMLARVLPALPWEYLDQAEMLAAITHSNQRCDEAAARVLSRGEENDWHRLRRRRRRLIQQLTAIEQCAIGIASSVRHARKLTSKLGVAQDLLVLRHAFKSHPELSPKQEVLLRVFLTQELDLLCAEAVAASKAM